MPFSTLVGNEPAKAALTRMLAIHAVPNTLLFAGPDGVGKSRFALHLAQALMGGSPKILTENHPDLHIYRTEGKGSLHPIESMRALIEEVGMPPFEAPAKVFILHDAHQMLPSSSNALLKTFEEPNLDSYIILLTSEPEMLLPTIVSRCRTIPFFPIPDPFIADYAVQHLGKTPQEAQQLAFLAQGSLGKAHQLAGAPDAKKELLQQILLCQDYPQFLKLCTQLEEVCCPAEEESSARHVDAVFEEIAAWYRDLHLLAQGGHPSYLYHPVEQLRSYERPLPRLEHVLESLTRCRLAQQRNIKLRVILEELFFQLN